MKNEYRVVFDANVVLSAFLTPRTTARLALDRGLQVGKVLISDATLAELIDVVGRSKFDRYLPAVKRSRLLITLLQQCEPVVPSETITDCRDPKDNQYLELAVGGNATHLVTGDKDLLVLNPFRGILILQPQDFLATIAQG
jgi:uncharacterized protein